MEQAVPALLGLVSGATQQANKKETHAQYKIQMYCLLPPLDSFWNSATIRMKAAATFS